MEKGRFRFFRRTLAYFTVATILCLPVNGEERTTNNNFNMSKFSILSPLMPKNIKTPFNNKTNKDNFPRRPEAILPGDPIDKRDLQKICQGRQKTKDRNTKN